MQDGDKQVIDSILENNESPLKGDKKNIKYKIDLKSFGKQLMSFRESVNKSCKYFAEELGLSSSYIHGLESGKHIPSYNFLLRMTEVYENLSIKLEIESGVIVFFFINTTTFKGNNAIIMDLPLKK